MKINNEKLAFGFVFMYHPEPFTVINPILSLNQEHMERVLGLPILLTMRLLPSSSPSRRQVLCFDQNGLGEGNYGNTVHGTK